MWWVYLLISALALLILFFAAWIFMIGAGSGKALGKLRGFKYAHRGLHGNVGYDDYCAENSLTAFRRACEMGYGIELDVRLSSDGVVMVFHDDSLARVCGIDKNVIDMSAEELSEVYLDGTADRVPTFREVLDVVAGRVPLLIELKGENFNVELAERTVEILKSYEGEYIFESFNPLLLRELRRIAPEIPRGILVTHYTRDASRRGLKYSLMQRLLTNFLCRPHFISMERTYPRLFPMPLVSRLFGTAKMAWTIRSAEQEREAHDNGFEGMIFENYLSEKNDI